MARKELNLFDTMYPVYYLSKLLGLAQFRITGMKGSQEIKKEYNYIVIIQCIIIVSPIVYGIYLLDIHAVNDVVGTVFRLQVIFSLPVTIIIVCSFFIHRHLIISSIYDMLEVDRILQNLGIPVSYKNARRFAIIEMLFFTLIFLWKAVLQLYSTKITVIIVYTIMNIFGYINTIILCQYFNIVFLMKQRYICIKRKLIYLRKINKSNIGEPTCLMYPNDFVCNKKKLNANNINYENFLNTATPSELQLLNKIHNTLHNISVKVTRAYGVQLLLVIGMRFITIVLQLLNAYKLLVYKSSTKGTVVNDILTFLYLFLHASKIFAVCAISADTANKSREIDKELYKISSYSENLKRNVNDFSVRLLLQDTRFNVCGFFTLDYVLLYNITGALTTYVIFLIQFDYSATYVVVHNITAH